jgi:hypothetical protein
VKDNVTDAKRSALRLGILGQADTWCCTTKAGVLPSSDAFEAMGKFNEEMVKAGVMLGGDDGLHPTSKGARIRFDSGKTTVTDGPFTESKELIAGYCLLQVKSKEEAIAWIRRAPFGDGTVIELHQVHESEDFAATTSNP